jgi:hypothetical protein
MRIGVDLDGVVARFNMAFAKVANQLWPGKVEPDPQPLEWDWSDLGFTEAEVDRVWAEIKRIPNWWITLPAYRENVFAIATHRTMHPEDEIFYLTARVSSAGIPTMHQSQRWLDMCGIGGLGTAVIVKPDGVRKVSIYKRIGVTHAIDDNLPNVMEGPHIIHLLDRPWNRVGREGKLYVHESLGGFFELVNQRRDGA